MAKTQTVSTSLKCTGCGTTSIIQRKKCRQKKSGHIKHMYCWQCREIQAFTELKGYESDRNALFWITYNLTDEATADSGICAEITKPGGQ